MKKNRQFIWITAVAAAVHCTGVLAAATDPPTFIDGIQQYQVFVRDGKVGEIAFRAKGTGELTAGLYGSDENKPLLEHKWQLNKPEGTALAFSDVPVGGEYTLRFKLGDNQGESDANQQRISVYKDRLTAMANTIRRYADNPELIMLVVQLSYVTEPPGNESPYVGRLRETQRQFCASDPRAILIPALPYTHCDVVHLNRRGYFALGDRIGECMAQVIKSGKVTWQGPRMVSAKFADQSRRKIRVTFDSIKQLKLLDEPLGAGDYGKGYQQTADWLVSDDLHQGYAEILAARIEGRKLLVDLAGCTMDKAAANIADTTAKVPLTCTGYLQPKSVTVDGLSVLLELPEAALPCAKVSYGLMSNSLCTLVDEQNRAAATFADVPIAEP